MTQKFYAARHTDRDICRKSSSGGAFTAITDSWFQTYGDTAVVYGCILDEQLKARHSRANTPQLRDAMRGSKYIGSDMSGIMNQVEADLKSGNYVLFSGTPCQIGGLQAFLKAKGVDPKDQLLTVEVICHGVGSVRYFRDYIASYEKRYKSKAVGCSFRGKQRPGKRTQMVIQFENGHCFISASSRYDDFLSAYSGNYILRPSCFRCPYAQKDRVADITIGDYWQAAGEDTDVWNIIISNSSAGEQWIWRSEGILICREIPESWAEQPQLSRPTPMPDNYNSFWKSYEEKGYNHAISFLGNNTFRGKVKRILAVLIYQLRLLELLRIVKRKGKK